MAEDIPFFPKSNSIFINSGNIVNWNRLKRKPTQSPKDELSESIGATLADYLSTADRTELQYITDLSCVHTKYKETLPEEERLELKITVKLFLCSLLSPEAIREAVQKALDELGVSVIETVLLSFPPFEDADDLTLSVILPYWNVLEDLVEKGIVLSTGVCDMDKSLLEQLYEVATTKPSIDQVNLESCCVMPPDLKEYATENDILLLTHNDPKDILPTKSFREIIAGTSTETDGENWEPSWILRYSVLVKRRGIIKTKGYLVSGARKTKKKVT